MIQLPSKIRTTLFSISPESDPLQLFSHENDRLLALIYTGATNGRYVMVGRSAADLANTDGIYSTNSQPVMIYGSEPLWILCGYHGTISTDGIFIVHAIYRA